MGNKPNAMLQIGDRVPGFELQDSADGARTLSKLLENGPVLLFFFKGSCPVCQMTAPFVERLAAGKSLQIVGVSQDERQATAAFAGRFGLTFPIVLDSVRDGYIASNGFGIGSVPSFFAIEPDARISTAFTGFSKAEIEALGRRMEVQPFHADEKVPLFRPG